MSYITDNVAQYIDSKGINITKMSKATDIEYGALYDSLGRKRRGRDLRDEELVKVCQFLGVNPMDFADEPMGAAKE